MTPKIPLTAHALAKILLAGPDLPVVMADDGDPAFALDCKTCNLRKFPDMEEAGEFILINSTLDLDFYFARD